MRKFFMILTLAVSYLATTGVAGAIGLPSPTCGSSCPDWVR